MESSVLILLLLMQLLLLVLLLLEFVLLLDVFDLTDEEEIFALPLGWCCSDVYLCVLLLCTVVVVHLPVSLAALVCCVAAPASAPADASISTMINTKIPKSTHSPTRVKASWGSRPAVDIMMVPLLQVREYLAQIDDIFQ